MTREKITERPRTQESAKFGLSEWSNGQRYIVITDRQLQTTVYVALRDLPAFVADITSIKNSLSGS